MTEHSTTSDGAAGFEEFAERQRAMIPPVVYLPVVGVDGRDHEVEMRTTNDGRIALLAYTALDRLAACCGPGQSWILAHTERLADLEQTQAYDVIYFDLPLPEDLRKEASIETEEGSGSGEVGPQSTVPEVEPRAALGTPRLTSGEGPTHG
ncbi:MAG: hypothetical protein LCH66_04540 [Actinobacteria bacterium]|jgi:hypothetical protein|nr:hypothetical protein [Actinomycetota bacterium]